MEIRFELDPNSHLVRVPVHINGQGPFWFTLDTGAVATSISTTLASRLGIATHDDAKGRKYKVSVPSREARLHDLQIGSQRLENEEVLVVDFPKLLGACCEEVRGLIGHSTLKDFTMTVNYGTQVLTLEEPGTRATSDDARIAWTPFDYIGNTHLVGVPVSINNRGPFRFVLDTGAGATVITSNLAKKLKLQGDGCEGECRGVGGATSGRITEVDSLSVGVTRAEKSQVAIVDLSAVTRKSHLIRDGIVGYTFLKDFELILDYPNRRFALLGSKRSVLPDSGQQQQSESCSGGSPTGLRQGATGSPRVTHAKLL